MKMLHKSGEMVQIITQDFARTKYNEDVASAFWQAFGGKTVVIERCCEDYYICKEPQTDVKYQVFPCDISSYP